MMPDRTAGQSDGGPYTADEVAALRRAKDWPMPTATPSQLIERGFDQARRFYLAVAAAVSPVGVEGEDERGVRVEEVQADDLAVGDRLWDYRNTTGESWQPITRVGRDADDGGVLLDLKGGDDPEDRVYYRPEWKVLRLAASPSSPTGPTEAQIERFVREAWTAGAMERDTDWKAWWLAHRDSILGER